MFRFMSNASTALAIVLVCAVFVAPDRAFACSCAVPAGVSQKELVRQELAGSDAVFVGEVVGIELPPSGSTSTEPMTVTFRVSEAWKGTADETVDVQTAASEIGCGYPFNKNVSYLVFASERSRGAGGLEVGLCGSTKPLSEAEATLATLGPVGVPTDPPPTGDRLPDTSGMPSGVFDSDRALPFASAVGALVLAVAAVRSVCRGRPRR